MDYITKLHEQMVGTIKNSTNTKKIAIAFSGGVDSSLLAKISSNIGYEILLLTVGFEGSHDIEFSKNISTMLQFKHVIDIISLESFSEVTRKIKQTIKTENLSWNENCIAFYYVSKLAQNYGIKTVLTSNGIDELFCGYNAYREAIDEGEQAVIMLMNKKLDNEIQMMKAVNAVSSEFDVTIIQPFLSKKFIEFAKTIPIEEKIKDKDDMIRKHIVRKLALTIGIPKESALKRKKALQYGSLIHKNLVKVKKY
ncbi:Asparagine synthase [uncultured archaeon]|nr:Asparagine synthase [uncultured archaeon]